MKISTWTSLTILVLSSSLEPLREVTNKVEEEIAIGDADDLVADLHKERKAL